VGKQLLARGMGASPGTATGKVVFRSEDAMKVASEGESVILVRIDATADDVPGMRAAAGILTTRGGVTGDAAIVARALGKPCIASCAALRVDYSSESLFVTRSESDGGDIVLHKGDVITVDGARGDIYME
jgi:pyruvate,orthophosphate dikinase